MLVGWLKRDRPDVAALGKSAGHAWLLRVAEPNSVFSFQSFLQDLLVEFRFGKHILEVLVLDIEIP